MSDTPEALRLADELEHDLLHTIALDKVAAAELRRLHAEREALRAEVKQAHNAGFVEASRIHGMEIERLRAECDALRVDAERWRAVRGWFRVMSPNIDGNHGWCPTGEWGRHRGITIDAVADAARAALKEAK